MATPPRRFVVSGSFFPCPARPLPRSVPCSFPCRQRRLYETARDKKIRNGVISEGYPVPQNNRGWLVELLSFKHRKASGLGAGASTVGIGAGFSAAEAGTDFSVVGAELKASG